MTIVLRLKRAVLLFAALTALLTGCGGGAPSSSSLAPAVNGGVDATPVPSPVVALREMVREAFYPPPTVAQMTYDAAAIGARYAGTPFSTSQYGQCFIEGTADVKDVFDARIPANYAILARYANGENPAHVPLLLDGGLYAWPKSSWIYRYSRAATHFMADFGYDAIAFFPDEYQAVLTRDDDTWLFIRDSDPRIPSAPVGTRFYSNRVVQRALTIMGSYNVAAQTRRPPMAQCPLPRPLIEFFYVPDPLDGLGYTPYVTLMDSPVSDQENVGDAASRYIPTAASPGALQLRAQAGVIASPLSNRTGVRVGKWVQTRFASRQVSPQLGAREQGFSYVKQEETELTNTWGPYGNYVLPLDPAFAASPAPPDPRPVVTALDHVVLRSADAKALFTLLTQTLGLPEAWSYAAYPNYSTGGVQLGNANLETLGVGSATTSIYGLVFQPCGMLAVLGDLSARGADPGGVEVTTSPSGVDLWRNVMLRALGRGGYIAYLCEYAPGARAALARVKQAPPLGGAGVLALREVVMASPTPDAVKRQWEQVMAPLRFDAEGRMRFPGSPALRVVPGTHDQLLALVLQVASLATARVFVQQQGLLGSDSGTELRLDATRLQGLDIRLVE